MPLSLEQMKQNRKLWVDALRSGNYQQGREYLRAGAIADAPFEPGDRWPAPLFRSVDARIPGRVGRLRAYGNAIVPALAAEVIGAYLDIARAA